MNEQGWEYIGDKPHPKRCFWCTSDGSACTYECIIPDPADELKDRMKQGMYDWHPRRKRDDTDEEW